MSTPAHRAWAAFVSRAKTFGAVSMALRHNPLVRGPVRRAIKTMRAAELAERRDLSDALLATLLRDARRTPYGRAFPGDYETWPVLTKAPLRDAPGDFVIRGLPRLPRLSAHTGGATGTPLKLLRSVSNVAAEQAFLDDMIASALPGLSWSRARIAVLRADSFKDPRDRHPPYWTRTHWNRRLLLSAAHLSRETVEAFHAALTGFRPDILWTTPTKAANLLRLLEQAGLRFQAPLVLCSSERLYKATFEALRREFAATVIDYYGQAERVSFAMAVEPEGFRFSPAYGRVELRLTAGDRGAEGRRLARIIASGFWNPAMPLVRYDTGDFAIVPAGATAADLEAIALGVRSFPGISGRDQDFVYAPDGLKLGDLDLVPRDVSNVLQIQIVQETLSDVVIRTLARPAFGRVDAAKLLANARACLPATMSARVEVVDRLEQAVSGKTPFIIRRVEPGCGPHPPLHENEPHGNFEPESHII